MYCQYRINVVTILSKWIDNRVTMYCQYHLHLMLISSKCIVNILPLESLIHRLTDEIFQLVSYSAYG